MTGLRNRKGWLTAEALKAGELEQWATTVADGGRVVVQLEHVEPPTDSAVLWMPWLTSHTRVSPSGETTTTASYSCFRLNAAREKFTELKNRHSQS